MSKKISGTFEWATKNANYMKGCNNDCKYCYARYNACIRFKTIPEGDWTNEIIDWPKVKKKWGKVKGTIMFPTQSDISPDTLDACIECLRNVLEPGNDVLIVSKPHLDCIRKLCEELADYKDHILFRFTIGAMSNSVLSYWEPNAPTYFERRESLIHAFKAGFETSISAEPLLESERVKLLIQFLSPYVTDSIWIGKLNNIDQRVEVKTDEDRKQVELIKAGQTDKRIKEIYEEFKDDPIIKWKNSYKEILGLELAAEPGLDI